MGFIGVLAEKPASSDTVLAVQEEEEPEMEEVEFESPEESISMTELKSYSSSPYGSTKSDDSSSGGKKGMDGKVIGLWILGVLCVVLLGIVLWNRGKSCTQKEKDAIRDAAKSEIKARYSTYMQNYKNTVSQNKEKVRKVLEDSLGTFDGSNATLQLFDRTYSVPSVPNL